MPTSNKDKADMLMELILNTDRKMAHAQLEPANLRHLLERVAQGAFTTEEANWIIGFSSGVCLSFGWIDYKDLKEIKDGTYRRKAKPRSVAPDTARKQLGSTDEPPKGRDAALDSD